ncbi:MAG: M20/M25/M40 family metallo-hydrolase [Asgard group archaeon]|nr:M20/M25/M40 family metallo-hydrolase [Asgard group archaeon]
MVKSTKYIDERSVLNLAKRLIKTQSISGNEKKLVTLLAIELKKAGFNRVQYDEQNYNIIGTLPGLSKGMSLMLVGHLDTVPAGGMEKPFQGLEMEGSKFGTNGKVIYGRGACDMKAALAAMISAGGALKRARVRLKGGFTFVGLTNTKNGHSKGLEDVLSKFELDPDYILSCAPTNMNINVGHPGEAIFDILTYGKMTNIGALNKGENAILKMQKILKYLLNETSLPEDKIYGKANMFVSSIISKPVRANSLVPSQCKANLVRQYFKNEKPEEIKKELLDLLKKYNFKEKEDVKISLKRSFPPLQTKENSEIISFIQQSYQEIIDKKTEIGFWKNGINLSEILNVDYPIVGFGPGDDTLMHTAEEHVPINQIITAAKIYAALAEQICLIKKS